jgi:hypothetical protein
MNEATGSSGNTRLPSYTASRTYERNLYPVHLSIRQIKDVVMMSRSFTDTDVSEEYAASTYGV